MGGVDRGGWSIREGQLAGTLLLLGFLAFFFNIVMSLGLRGVIGIFLPAKTDTKELVLTAV